MERFPTEPHRKWRLMLWVLVAGLFVLGWPACKPPEKPIRVGANAWPGYEPMFLARSLGYYKEHQIQLIDFPSTTEANRAYRNGLIDVVALTADESLSIMANQPGQHCIVMVCDFSNGADAILAKPEIKTMQDLKGRRIGVETTAIGAYVLARALDESRLSSSEVQIIPMPLLEQETALNSGEVDAVVTYEPHSSRLLAAGARKLFDSKQIYGEVVDVLLTRRNLSPSQSRQLTALLSGWFRALEYLHKNRLDAAERMALREGVKPQQFLNSLEGLELIDRTTNLRLLGKSTNNLSLTLQRLAEVMLKHKIVSQSIESPVLDDSFVRVAKP